MKRSLYPEEWGLIGLGVVALFMLASMIVMIIGERGRPSALDRAREIDPHAQCLDNGRTLDASCAARGKWWVCSPDGCAEAPGPPAVRP